MTVAYRRATKRLRTATAGLCAVAVLGACGSSGDKADPPASTTPTTAVPTTTTTLPLSVVRPATIEFLAGPGAPLMEFLRIIGPYSKGTAIERADCDKLAPRLGTLGTAKQLIELAQRSPDPQLGHTIGNLGFILELSLVVCRQEKKTIPSSAVVSQQQQYQQTVARLKELGIPF